MAESIHNHSEDKKMNNYQKGMKKIREDEDYKDEFNREFYGDTIDNYMRKRIGMESWETREARLENEQYWADYTRNTGVEPKYPYRVGKEWNKQPIETLPMVSQITGKTRAIDMLYGGQS